MSVSNTLRSGRGAFAGMLLFVVCLPVPLQAYIPRVVGTEPGEEPLLIDDVVSEQYFYGRLESAPHTYVLSSTEPFLLTTRVLVPDMDGAHTDVNAIIVKREGRQGSVVEVARILSRDTSWTPFHESVGGDEYTMGGTYEKDLEPGTYYLEVSAPNNDTPYVLVVGREGGRGTLSYFEMLSRISDVKVFYGYSRLRVVESPYGYIPLLILLSAALGVWWYRQRRKAS